MFAPRERLSAWRDFFGQAIFKLEIEPYRREGFRAETMFCPLPGLRLMYGTTAPARHGRRRHMVDNDDILFSMPMAGTALFRTYGDARTEGGRVPASGDTLFLLFSQTKVLTSAAVWTLVEEGRLSFMDKISDHLPEFAALGKGDITLHQVMTHQGGFPSGDVSRESWADHARMRAEVCDFSLDWTPGSRLQYHPRAAHLTQAMVIEAVTRRDYREVIRDHVLAPLGLDRDIYVGVPAGEQERCADTDAESRTARCHRARTALATHRRSRRSPENRS